MVYSSAVDLVRRAWLTLFVVAIGASVAHADQITYTFVSHAGAQDSDREDKMRKRIVIVCSVLGLAAGSWAIQAQTGADIQAQTGDDIQAQAGDDNGGPVANGPASGEFASESWTGSVHRGNECQWNHSGRSAHRTCPYDHAALTGNLSSRFHPGRATTCWRNRVSPAGCRPIRLQPEPALRSFARPLTGLAYPERSGFSAPT